ncbi:carbamoyl-phosphate synthase [Platysternon megacephalum]|uniref:Carbamoyl-phosphate synthase n=1 Tax=Platysternon megacephalum TaxID=55544 RepID=A0A4D9DKW8_9SAUR|nr:carbamoyl-phosphate synthase [Platysternon megacephalum]
MDLLGLVAKVGLAGAVEVLVRMPMAVEVPVRVAVVSMAVPMVQILVAVPVVQILVRMPMVQIFVAVPMMQILMRMPVVQILVAVPSVAVPMVQILVRMPVVQILVRRSNLYQRCTDHHGGDWAIESRSALRPSRQHHPAVTAGKRECEHDLPCHAPISPLVPVSSSRGRGATEMWKKF